MRTNFPFFSKETAPIYLDSSATTQKPQQVIDTLTQLYSYETTNVHRSQYPLSTKLTQKYENVRDIITTTFNVPQTHQVIFTTGCTHSLNLLAQSLKPILDGKKIILSKLEHHANIVPWQQLAKELNLTIEYIPLTDDLMLDMDAAKKLITKDVAIVSVTQLSNVLGTVVDVKTICELADKAHAISIIDGAQGAAHSYTNIETIGCDFYVAGSHKIYGPTGAGFLIGNTDLLLRMDPYMTGGNMIKQVYDEKSTWNDIPYKFEAGTQSIHEIIAMGEAITYFNRHKTTILDIEKELTDYAKNKLRDTVDLLEPTTQESIISFTTKHPTHDIVTLLGEKNICVRGGHHCCMPLLKSLNLNSTVRVSIGAYTTKEDIDAFVDALTVILQLLGE